MSPVVAVAWMTVTEARRNRIAWTLLFFCLVLLLTSFLFQEVTIFDQSRVLRNVGLATIHLFGAVLAVFLGVSAVTREIERKTVYFVLSKPIDRRTYLAGKLLGIWLAIAATSTLMLAAFLLENWAFGGRLGAAVFQAFWLMQVEFLLIASFAILASTFTSSLLAAFMSAGLFVIGHFAADLYFFSARAASPLIRGLGAGVFYLLPNLERLNLKTEASLLAEVPLRSTALASLYGLLYVGVFLLLAFALFLRRDLK